MEKTLQTVTFIHKEVEYTAEVLVWKHTELEERINPWSGRTITIIDDCEVQSISCFNEEGDKIEVAKTEVLCDVAMSYID